MSKKYTTTLIVIVSVIAVLGIAVGVSFAIWIDAGAGKESFPVSDLQVINTTAKYLVFEIWDKAPDQGGKCFYASYYVDEDASKARTGIFKNNMDYNTKYFEDGVTIPVAQFVANDVTQFARVIGFVDSYGFKADGQAEYIQDGYILGEVETVDIPDTIKVDINNTETSIKVTEISMQSPEEFSVLRGIKSVKVPANVKTISGVSFTGCVNLKKVEYVSPSSVDVEENCFRACGVDRNLLLPSKV